MAMDWTVGIRPRQDLALEQDGRILEKFKPE